MISKWKSQYLARLEIRYELNMRETEMDAKQARETDKKKTENECGLKGNTNPYQKDYASELDAVQ